MNNLTPCDGKLCESYPASTTPAAWFGRPTADWSWEVGKYFIFLWESERNGNDSPECMNGTTHLGMTTTRTTSARNGCQINYVNILISCLAGGRSNVRANKQVILAKLLMSLGCRVEKRNVAPLLFVCFDEELKKMEFEHF